MGKNKIFVFDFDGTIVDSIDEIVKITSKYFPSMTRDELRKTLTDLYVNKNIFSFLKILYYEFIILFHLKSVINYIDSHTDSLPLIPGIAEILRRLNQNNVRLFIVSSNFTENIQDYIRANHLDFFEKIYGAGSFWSKAQNIQNIKKQNPNSEIYYIGDEVRDVIASKKAGVKSIAVTWGMNNKEDFIALKPDYILDKPDQLLEISFL